MLQHTEIVAKTQPAAHTTGAPEEFFTRWSQQGIRVARLFAEVSLAMGDSAIAAWDQKYLTAIDLWRPISAITEAASDGNAANHRGSPPGSRSRPIYLVSRFSPCFPAWVSGHATFGGAWAKVMENEFSEVDATDPFPLTLTTEDPHSQISSSPPVFDERQFDTFAEAGAENARSRIYLGVHYQFDADDGVATGVSVANRVRANELRPIQTCVDWSCGETIE